ncbi:MAG: two-component sensor histidine kinase [Paenibacillaceae bacterium]|nr:MAG: two-component sensor histidine kinase [Paenibacillaceae bacterium]
MPIKTTIFGKIVVLIVSLLIPILMLYSYFYKVSVDVVKSQVVSNNWNRLSFFMSQMESTIDQLTKFSVVASRLPSMRDFLEGGETETAYERFRKRARIEEQLILQNATSVWVGQLTVFMPDLKDMISTDYSIAYDEVQDLLRRESQKWTHIEAKGVNEESAYFSRYTHTRLNDKELLVEVRFQDDNIRNMLSEFKRTGGTSPFFYHPELGTIQNRDSDAVVIEQLVSELNRITLDSGGSKTIAIDRGRYSVNYLQSKSLGWYLIDYEPIEDILSPITKSRNLFYVSVALLLVMSMLASLLLYWQVQMPIKQLIRGVQGLKHGNYAIRLSTKVHNEFEFLFLRFNQMAEQIQQLIETIYEEKIRVREATLKQLQSQINPHFLYNCLFFIKNMASMGNKDAVIAMALNLGEYYRYNTRVDSDIVTVEDEMRLVANYLTIQNLRLERFHFEIDIPDTMRRLPIPRLTVQPLVENAVIHGVEKTDRFGIIRITGRSDGSVHRIVVEDNGPGMSAEELDQLQWRLSFPMDDEMGCGLWNVHQRLLHRYRGGSGVKLSLGGTGGLTVVMQWETDARG